MLPVQVNRMRRCLSLLPLLAACLHAQDWSVDAARQLLAVHHAVRLRNSGDPATAARQLAAVVKASPHYAEAWLELGLTRGKLGDTAGKVSSLAIAVRRRPQWAEARVQYGLALALNGQRTAALAQAAALEPLDPAAAERLRLYARTIIVNWQPGP